MDTVLADDPELTCRLPGMERRSPQPFVMSRARGLPESSRLSRRGAQALRGTLPEALAELGRVGINRLLVEGGAKLARSLLEAGLVDEFHLFRAPLTIGGNGVDGLAGLPLEEALRGFAPREEETLGADRLSVYEART
jgi:diaminohydroxyphosphoribosylaminopyrimidine deaminase/5-amino-6-(5-phosphoribosylamino)uracil reductase